MAQRNYSVIHSLVQKVASSGPGAWMFSKSVHHIDRLFLRLTNGRTSSTSILSGLPVVTLTTIGAKSGLPRTSPLLCIRDEASPDTFAVIASNWGQRHHPAWYYNLRANPRVKGSIRGQVGDYVAHEASGEEYEKYWQAALDTYIGFPAYEKRAGNRQIPIMVLTPAE